jgi:hypothetical protein
VGLGCVLFLWGMLAMIAVAAAAIGATIFFAAVARRSTFGMVAGGLLGIGGAIVALGAIVFIAGWLLWGGRPHETTSRSAFADAFGVPADADVTGIRSRTTSSSDYQEQFLRFHAPPATIAGIVRTRFQHVPVERCDEDSRQHERDVPPWWKPASSRQLECYVADPFDDSFASNSASLMYDPSTGDAHFHSVGVD